MREGSGKEVLKVEILVVEDGFTSLATGRYRNRKTKMERCAIIFCLHWIVQRQCKVHIENPSGILCSTGLETKNNCYRYCTFTRAVISSQPLIS